MPTMHGWFARWNEWALIDSTFEGTFLERIAPGAFARSLARDRAKLRVLFQHGRELIPGLEAGAYGASFRFKVLREDLNQNPPASAYNPDALPERTIREARVMEFGPVTFPAYEGATAGVRSLSDWFALEAAA